MMGGQPSSTSYGSVGVDGVSGDGGVHKPVLLHEEQATLTPAQVDPEEEDDLFAVMRNDDDGSSLAWRVGVFVTRPRWWFAVVVMVTLYTLYTNQRADVSGVPEPGYLIEPNVYETKWWDRWWSPWGEAILDAVDLAADEKETHGRNRTSSSSSSSSSSSRGGGGGG